MKLICLGLCLVGAPATGQEGFCDLAQTQFEINDCTAAEMEAADVGLNQAYKAAMAAMKQIDAWVPKPDRGAAAALLRAQKAWITVRDDTCTAQGYQMYGGSARQSQINGCKTLMIRTRTEELWRLVQDG